MGLGSKVSTLVEISPHGDAGVSFKVREEQANEIPGDTVCNHPSVFCTGGFNVKGLFSGDESMQIVAIAAKAEVQTAVGIQFNVKITGVAIHRREEELQTAVLAGDTYSAGVFRADILLNSSEFDIKVFIVVTQSAFRFDIDGV